MGQTQVMQTDMTEGLTTRPNNLTGTVDEDEYQVETAHPSESSVCSLFLRASRSRQMAFGFWIPFRFEIFKKSLSCSHRRD